MTRLNEREEELVALLCTDCKTPGDLTAKLKELFAGSLEKILEAEMEEHLGYEKNSVIGNNSGNSRNGYGKKRIKSEWGESEIEVPRDRNGTFAPQVIEKRQTRTDDIEARILAMYSKGMSTRDIEDQLRDIYGIDASYYLQLNIDVIQSRPVMLFTVSFGILGRTSQSLSMTLFKVLKKVFLKPCLRTSFQICS
jgi:putative transposase